MKEQSIIGSTTESVDLAALLLALNFPLMDACVIKGQSLDNSRDPRKTMSWKFAQKSVDGRYDVDKVKRGWVLPKSFTLDVLQLSRLLAHNLAIIKSVAKRPQGLIYSDLGGIGIVGDEAKSDDVKDLAVHTIGYGGTCDTQAIALAITLGVRPSAMYVRQGRLYMVFDYKSGAVNIDDVIGMLKDDNMRDERNTKEIAVLICQLDNRGEILANIDKFRQKVRLIADGGDTQVMYDPNRLSAKDKERIYKFFDS